MWVASVCQNNSFWWLHFKWKRWDTFHQRPHIQYVQYTMPHIAQWVCWLYPTLSNYLSIPPIGKKMQSWHSKALWMKASTTWHRGAVCGQFLAAGLFLLFILQLINIKLLTKEKKSISKSKATWQGIIFHPLLWFIICPSWCDVLPFSFPTSAKCNLEVYCGKQQGLHSSGFSHLAGRKVCVDLLMSWNDNEEKKWCVFEKGSESECGSP